MESILLIKTNDKHVDCMQWQRIKKLSQRTLSFNKYCRPTGLCKCTSQKIFFVSLKKFNIVILMFGIW